MPRTKPTSSAAADLQPLPRTFYSPSARVVAPELLGHYLLRRTSKGVVGGAIVEVEAYLADDPACHSYGGQTARNQAMFGPPGHAYVYLIYGYHYCVNAVCQPAGTAEAVLVRALQVDFGETIMREARAVERVQDLTNGPAKLCEALRIDRALDAIDLCDPASELFVACNPNREELLARSGPLKVSKRIGISKAADLQLRFLLAGNAFISRK